MDLRETGCGRVCTGHNWSGQGPVASCCVHGNEPSGSITAGNCFTA
jgi:hypothetical protein